MKVVDVIMLTYNHENFIAQAIEGVLMQEARFDIKLYIADDASTDHTSEICKEYAEKFPNRINYLMNTKNLGANTNFVNVFSLCQSQYVAICEGDDYWTNPHKLQKQVDFLEANPGYAICFHAVNILENGVERPSELNHSDKEETFSILDLANTNLMHTPSVVYRNGLINNFPEWFNQSPVGDYVLHLLNAKKGLIKYLPDVMAVYRIHEGGVWSQKNMGEIYPRTVCFLNNLINEDFSPEVKEVLKGQKQRRIQEHIIWIMENKDYSRLEEISEIYKNEPGSFYDILTIVIKQVNKLESDLRLIKNSRTFKLAQKISRLKIKKEKKM